MESKEAFRGALVGSRFEERELVAMPVLDTSELVFAVAIDVDEVESAWRDARALVGATGRWPVAVELWSSHAGASLFARVTAANLFSRYGFDKSGEGAERLPQAVIERSKTVDVDAFLDELEKEASDDDPEGTLEFALGATSRFYDEAPVGDELAALGSASPLALDRSLLDWELARGERVTKESMEAEWYVPDDPVLVFLPTPVGSEALAYLSWWGSTYHDAACDVALLRRWEEEFGAELVSHYGTMLQFLAMRPPTSIDAAWKLGREHCLVAPCNLLLPGLELRHYARGLVESDRWMLHERP